MPNEVNAVGPSEPGNTNPGGDGSELVIDDELLLQIFLDSMVKDEAVAAASADEDDPLNEEEMLEP